MPLYDPYVTPIFYASFIYQDSSIKAVYFYYAALTAQWSLYALSRTFPLQTMPLFFYRFVHTLPWSFFLLYT